MKRIILIIAALIFTTSSIFPKNVKTPKINKKQKKQIVKINQGIKSGELTGKEAKKLLKQERKLQKQKKIAKSDGFISPKERTKLRKETKKMDAKIYKQKHDKQKRR